MKWLTNMFHKCIYEHTFSSLEPNKNKNRSHNTYNYISKCSICGDTTISRRFKKVEYIYKWIDYHTYTLGSDIVDMVKDYEDRGYIVVLGEPISARLLVKFPKDIL